MSGYSKNAVYSRIKEAVLTVNEDAYCSSVVEPVPPKFPAVSINEVSNYENRNSVNLDFDDSQWTSTFQIQVFSNKANGGMSEAVSILDAVSAEFKRLYYIREFEQTVPNTDPNVYRLVAEYSRKVGSGDQLPQKGNKS